MSYNPTYEASKALSLEYIAQELEDFAATGQDLSGRRFSRSPPRVPSVPSTTYEESEPPSPTAQLQDKETKELWNSTANLQFGSQIKDELDRIRTARDKGLLEHPNPFDLREAAEANIRYRWIQQGIWDERWASQPSKQWKHELQTSLPLVRPSDSAKESGVTGLNTRHKRKLSGLKEEYHETARSAVEYQDRQSSRPCYQFLYQFCQEREWIKMGLSNQDRDQQINLDAKAYEIVKTRWIKNGIWDVDWTFVPGTSWRHERPRKAEDPHGVYRSEDYHKAATIERAERPLRWYPMAPVAPLMRLEWPSRRPVSVEAASDSSSPATPEPRSKEKPFRRDHSVVLKIHTHTGLPRSTRKPSINSKDDLKGQGYEKPRISAKKRTSPRKEKNDLPNAAARRKETAIIAASSRPRRAAASKAMKNMAKMT